MSSGAMDADEIVYEYVDAIRIYRSGRVDRIYPDEHAPPSIDSTTGVQSKDVIINPSTGLLARLYMPPTASDRRLPIIVSAHCGGFCLLHSSSSIHHNYINTLTAKADAIAVSVDYRLAPENPLPAAYDDCWEALQWVCCGNTNEPWLSEFGDLERVFVLGESSGGNIVHNLGMRLRREGMKVEGLLMVHPYFWGKERIGNEGGESDEKKRKVNEIENLWPVVHPGTTGLDDPWINPLVDDAPSLAELGSRRVLMCTAELDILRERGRLYYKKLKESSWAGEAELLETEGEDHCFFLIPGSLKIDKFMDQLASFINKP